jgi:hypothetical protein
LCEEVCAAVSKNIAFDKVDSGFMKVGWRREGSALKTSRKR